MGSMGLLTSSRSYYVLLTGLIMELEMAGSHSCISRIHISYGCFFIDVWKMRDLVINEVKVIPQIDIIEFILYFIKILELQETIEIT